MIVVSSERSPQVSNLDINSFDISIEQEQAEAAIQLRELVDSLLQDHKGLVFEKEETGAKHLSMTKLIAGMRDTKNIDNYISIYVASRLESDGQGIGDTSSLGRETRSIRVVKTRYGREGDAVVYEFMDGNAVRRQENMDETPVQEGESTLTLDDMRDLHKLFGLDESRLVA